MELVEKTDSEEGVRNNIVQTENEGLLLGNCLMALSTHGRTTHQDLHTLVPVHLDPVAGNFEDQKQSVVILPLGEDMGQREVKRSRAEAITNHIQDGTKVRAYNQQEERHYVHWLNFLAHTPSKASRM